MFKKSPRCSSLLWLGAAALSVLLPLASQAQEIELPSKMPKIDGAVTLPIKGVQAIESQGQIHFISDNGRYLFVGQLVDMWSPEKNLSTFSQIKKSAELLNLRAMGADIDNLNTMVIGTGQKEVVAFVDPKCGICHKLMADAKTMGGEYSFKFISVPALGDESNALSRRLFCAEDKKQRLVAFMNNTIKTLPQQKNCNTAGYDKTLLVATLLPVDGVPFVIAPDGRSSKGYPKNLNAWLKGDGGK